MKTFLKSLVVAGLGLFGTAGAVEAATPWHSTADSYGIAAGGCYGPTNSYADSYRRYDRTRDAYRDTVWNRSASNHWNTYDRWNDDRYAVNDDWCDDDRWSSADRPRHDSYGSYGNHSAFDSWDRSGRSTYDRYDHRYDDRTRRSDLFEPWRPSSASSSHHWNR